MKIKHMFKNKPLLLLVAAAVLLLGSTVGSTRAALTYYSENYTAEVTVANIGVTLMENAAESETLFSNLLEEGESLVPGKAYDEVLSVKNTGSIDSYVRVVLVKSWQNGEGEKETTLSPDLIGLSLLTGDNGWIVDEAASTAERTVLYYSKVLAAGSETPAFADQLKIDPSVQTKVVEYVESGEQDGKTFENVVYEYAYDDCTFHVKAEVNAVQTHSAAEAIKSAWGVDVDVAADGTLSLK